MKCIKNVPRAGVGENFNFLYFSKSFQNWRKLSYFHFRATKISKFTHLEEKDAKEWNAKKMSLGLGWVKTSIFSIFRKVFKTEGNYHIFTLGQLKYQNSLIWKKKMPKSEMQKKMSLGLGWAKTSIFSIFWKVFKTKGNYHIFTLGQLKYQNILIWKKKMPKSERQKKCT